MTRIFYRDSALTYSEVIPQDRGGPALAEPDPDAFSPGIGLEKDVLGISKTVTDKLTR